ncbi:MAG TPA: hypothetical protein VGA67_02865 [Candidatus Dojkabacteria bacterium]
MKNLYLISNTGHWESVIENFYVSSVEEIEKVIMWERREYFYEKIKDLEVDFVNKKVKFTSLDEYDEYEEEYHLIPIFRPDDLIGR